jgi:hypothetical protein
MDLKNKQNNITKKHMANKITKIYVEFSNSNDKIDIVDLIERDYEQFLSLTTQIKAAYIAAKEKRDNNGK